MSTSIIKSCQRCGNPLSPGAPEGLCPTCLLREGLEPPLELESTEPPIFRIPLGTVRYFGDYELLEEIGRGGMGVVYKARQASLNRPVALKMILGGALASDTELRRFQAEAEAAATLDHQNIVAIHEVGEHAGQPYYSMQWVDGCSLAQWRDESELRHETGPEIRGLFAGQSTIAEFMAKVARAVHYAHQRGILHRDIKPGNILVDARGEPHVTDFGLAKRVEIESDLTQSGALLGTPNFMAPEQAAGRARRLTTAADIYSLGAVLYFLLTGRPPFCQPTQLETLRSVLEEEPAKPRSINPQRDGELETICLKCLEKDPQHRYSCADGLADDLERWLRREPIRARPAGAVEHIVKWARRKPALASALAAVILVAALGFAATLWQWRQTEHARRTAARAEQNAVERLYASYLAQARANRWSGRPGRRFDSLAALSNAAAIRPSLELRNEAIACLALPDVRVQRRLKGAPVTAPGGLAFDARMERYAQTLPDGRIAIRQVADDRELFRLPGPGDPWWAGLSFSPDGQYLAEKYTGPDTNQVLVWDLPRRKLVLAKPVSACSVSFRPDSRELAAAEENGSVYCYGVETGKELRRLKLPPFLRAISYVPQGDRLAAARQENPAVLIVRLESQEIERQFEQPAGAGLIAWNDDGSMLACPGGDGRTYLRNANTGELESVLEGHRGVVTGAAFNQAGDILLASGWDGTTRFWDAKLALPLVTLPGGWVPIAFGCGDRLGFGIGESDSGIWEVNAARECRRLGRTGVIWCGQFSPDSQLLVTASTDGIRIWQVEANRLLAQLQVQESRSVFFAPDGGSLISSGLFGLRRWPLQYTRPSTLALRPSPPLHLRIGEAAALSSAGLEGSCLSADGRSLIAACTDAADLLLFDLAKPGVPRPLTGHRMAASVTMSPNGRWFATGTWKGAQVKVWETASGQPVVELPVKGSAVAVFSPDGQWLVTGSAEEYRFWKVGSWERGLGTPRDRAGDMQGAVAFSPDSRMLALLRARNSIVQLVSVPDGREVATLETGQPLCFSRDGRFLATAGEDLRSVFVWDLRLIRQQLAALKLDW